MRYALIFAWLTFVAAFVAGTTRPAAAAPCKPPQSAAMLTGPVYQSIQAECDWVYAIARRDRFRAAAILAPTVVQVDSSGTVRDRTALLDVVARGSLGPVVMNVASIDVPFSAGSTNVLVSIWTFAKSRHRVTDVFFCDVFRTCVYKLISEQITTIAP